MMWSIISSKQSCRDCSTKIIRKSGQIIIDLKYNKICMFDEEFENEENQVYHACDCYSECNGQSCPCFFARNELCVSGSCCQTCIQMKNALIMADRGQFCTCKNTQCLKSYCKCFTNNAVCTSLCQCGDCENKLDSEVRKEAMQVLKSSPMMQGERKFCTCKKIKCDKKYCSCFSSGVKCSKFCSCENCTNCDLVLNEMEEERPPSLYKEEDLEKMSLPEKMSFESIKFSMRNSKNSRNSRNSKN